MIARAPRPAWAEVDLGAIRANLVNIATGLNHGTRIMAVVKANAYGHGDVEVARAALEAGAAGLGVVLLEEGIRLREAGIGAPVLLMQEPAYDRAAEVLARDLTPAVFTIAGLEALGAAAARAGSPIRAHVKIDTGLNRLGWPSDRIDEFALALRAHPLVEIEGAFTHFAFADEPDHPFISVQLSRFAAAVDELRAHGIEPRLLHAGNSAASLTRPDAHFDMVRVGIAMYGLSPGPKCDGIVALRPALTLKARAAMVKRVRGGEAVSYGHRYRLKRDATIVTIPLGYADGWPRGLSSNADVLIGGRRYPAVGTVCMDSFMADLGDDECEVGDEIVLIGEQGGERIGVEAVAAATGTINYEVVTRVSPRIPRVFRG
ncbi:MAG: alanine racemase [Actinomycetota bacterium]